MAVDNATVNLYINNEQAKGAIDELETSYQELKAARIAADKAGDTQESLELQAKEYNALQKLKESKRGVLDIEKAMSNLNVINLRQLTDVKRKLAAEMRELNRDTDEYKTKLEQLKRVEEQMAKARGKNNAEQKGFMASLKGAWSNIMPIAGIAGVVSAVAGGVKELISDVWSLTKTIQGDSKRAAQVFGDELGYVELQASKLSKQMGVTNREFVSMTTGVADLLIPLDFTRKEAAKMAVDVQKLSGALNEWTSGQYGVEEVSNRLTKAMLGETEGLKQLGIAIRLDSEEYKELIKQKENEGAASTAQAQALAILDLLYKKSADAQAAYNSSGNELLRFQNSASRGWREMKESMAEWFATTKVERVEKLARTYGALNEEFNRNEATLDRLLPTYTELSKKTNLNEIEQQQLRDAIDGIVQIIPHAATGFDEYGRALGINTAAMNTARESQRLLRLEMQKELVNDFAESTASTVEKLSKLGGDIVSQKDLVDNLEKNKQGMIMARGKQAVKTIDKETEKLSNLRNEYANTEKEIGKLVLKQRELGLSYDSIAQNMNIESDLELQGYQMEMFAETYLATMKTVEENPIVVKNPKDTNSKAESKPKSYSLEDDASFAAQRAILKKQLLAGEIATEEEHSRKLLALEISTLESRLATNKESGDDLLKLQSSLLDKQYQQLKSQKTEQNKIDELLAGDKPEIDRAKDNYRKQLIAYGLFTAEQLLDEQAYNDRRKQLTADQNEALLILNRRHVANISAINTKAISDHATTEITAIQSDVSRREATQNAELRELTTLEQKKVWLVSKFNYQGIQNIRTTKEADKALTKEYARENEEMTKKSLEKLIVYYKTLAATTMSLNPMAGVFNPEELAAYYKAIEEITEKLNVLKGGQQEDPQENKPKRGFNRKNANVDILGMAAGDWDNLFDNIDGTKSSLEKVVGVANAIGSAFNTVSNLMTALEQRDFRQYEKSQNDKKRSLDKRLKQGVISQENYNAQVESIDAQTEEKREEMERKQAERAKTLAIFQAIINTAVAVTAALGSVPFGPWNIALASIVAALGAVEVATIAATPGYEEGGYIDVERAQDGRRFRARNNPHARGYINEPTAIVAESGTELVIPNEGISNPTLKPVLDIVADSISRGDIRTVNFQEALSRPRGYQSGGYIQPNTPPSESPSPSTIAAPLDDKVLRQLIAAIEKLDTTASQPLQAYVLATGRYGAQAQLKRINDIKESAQL